MPGGLNGPALKQGLITAAPMFNAMAAGYASGRGPYAYMDQGAQAIQAELKRKRDEEAAAAASRAFSGLVPGGMGKATMGPSPRRVAAPPRDPNSPDAIASDAMFALGKINPDDREILAKTLMAEAGGEGYGGMLAAGAVIDNRRKSGGYGDGWRGVIMKPGQFSAWNSTTGYAGGEGGLDMASITPSADAYAAADAILTANYADPTGGATHYYNPAVADPKWGQQAGGDWTTIGNHVFGFADAGRAAPPDPMQDPYVQQLMQVMAMPGLTPEQQAVVQLQLKSRVDLLSKPQPGAEEEAARAMRARDADLLGYQRGSPEWTQYVVTGEMAKPASMTEGAPANTYWNDPGNPAAGVTAIPGVPPADGKAPVTKNVTLADGSEVMVQWNPQTQVWDAAPIPEGGTTGTGTAATTVGQVYNPNEIASVVGMIDQIANDPNLPDVVGQKAVLLGGGNIVGEMNLAQRLAYGQGGLSVIEKIGQLQSNAWLSARAMLKGGGPITDYESRKAEAAVARLERPKSEADFRAALTELKDAIVEGERKLNAARGGATAAPQTGPAQITDKAQYDALPSGAEYIAPDGSTRRKP